MTVAERYGFGPMPDIDVGSLCEAFDGFMRDCLVDHPDPVVRAGRLEMCRRVADVTSTWMALRVIHG